MTRVTPPDPALFDEGERIEQFWNEHFEELLARYPEQFVAVRDGEVIVACTDLEALYDALRDLGLRPDRDVAIEFISSALRTAVL